GIFRKYNLDPQLIYIIAGRAVQSMLAGDLNFGLIGATHVANAVTGGGDMTMLLGLESKLQFILVARPSVKKAEDLKGKKLAIGKENVPFQSSGLATSRKFIRSNPQLVENVAKAIVEGVAYVANPANKKRVVEIIGRNLKLDKPDRLEIAYQSIAGMFPRKP